MHDFNWYFYLESIFLTWNNSIFNSKNVQWNDLFVCLKHDIYVAHTFFSVNSMLSQLSAISKTSMKSQAQVKDVKRYNKISVKYVNCSSRVSEKKKNNQNRPCKRQNRYIPFRFKFPYCLGTICTQKWFQICLHFYLVRQLVQASAFFIIRRSFAPDHS